MWSYVVPLLALVAGLGWNGPAPAQERVDLELVLAVDISLSMDTDEKQLQRDGYVAAFRHQEVIDAITGGGYGRIAVTYVEWAGVASPQVVVPWMRIDGRESAERFARFIEAAPLSRNFRTSISGAISYSAGLFEASGFAGLRRVIDISGDGPNNEGPMVTLARDAAVAAGITINGLPIILKRGDRLGFFDVAELDRYYEACVIGGTGAFLVPVHSTDEFIPAIRRKLVLEIAGLEARVVPAQFTPERPAVDCLIGERLWQEWMNRGEGVY